MVSSDHEFGIYYSYPRKIRGQQVFHLGPLGDSLVASYRLVRNKDIFKSLFPVKIVYGDENRFVMSLSAKSASSDQQQRFHSFMNIFQQGIFEADLEAIFKKDRSLWLYLKELSTIRKFWLDLVDKGHYPSLLD